MTTEPSPVAPLARFYQAPSLCLRGREFAWGSRTYIMGILNITPDSFSGDGLGSDVEGAVALARRFEAEGADIIDLGAESSRPGAGELPPEQELRRLLPALLAVRAAISLPLSIDTYHAVVATAALAAGADMVNDIKGLRAAPEMAPALASARAPVVLMHNQRGRPDCDVIEGVAAGFQASLALASAAGIDPARIILDPGFGFGWRPEQNLELVRRLPELWSLGLPLLLGLSRKSTLGLVLNAPVEDRLHGTAAAVALAVAGGADIVRVHDVRVMVRVVRMADAIARGTWRPS